MTFDAGAIEARLILNRQQFQADLAAARAEGDAFDGKAFEARAKLNYDEVKAAFAKIAQDWAALRSNLERRLGLNVDNGEALGKMSEVAAAFEALRGSLEQSVSLKTDANAAASLTKQLAASGPVEQQLTINTDQASAALQDIQEKYLELRILVESGMRLEVDVTQFEDDLISAIDLVRILHTLVETPVALDVSNRQAIRSIAATTAAYQTMRSTLAQSIALGTVAVGGVGGSGGGGAGGAAAGAAAGAAGGRGGNSLFNPLRAAAGKTVGLFGGVLPGFLGAIGGLHLVAEAFIELAGTIIPATLAFVAFGAAATPTVIDLSKQMMSLHTVTQAFNTNLYPLTGGFQRMAAAVKPEVYVLFGEALTIASQKSGLFQQLATGAGTALDQLGARFTAAITGSSTFSTIIGHASQDLSGWGNLIGNIGGIIGNVLKVLPGYAEILLGVLNGVTHALEVLSANPITQWLLGVGLAAHGALVWIGLLATAFTVLASRGLAALVPILFNVALGLEKIGATTAANAMLKFATSAETAAALPWGWISLAAAAFGVLIYKLATAKDSVQSFFATLQQQAANAPVLALQATLTAQLAVAQADYAHATEQVARAQKAYNAVAASSPAGLKAVGLALYQAKLNQSDYAAGLQQIKDDQQIVNQHISNASVIFHGTAAAWAALNRAGITSAQLLDTNKQHWQQAIIEAQAYDNAIRAVTQTTGRYGAAQNALNFTAGDTANALGQIDDSMNKVTQAETTLFNTLIGGEGTFVAFAQGINTMATDSKTAGASLNNLGAAGIKLSGDFYTNVLPAAEKNISALQDQSISTGDLTKAIATQSAQMLPYTKHNEAARVAIVDLINNALGPGTVSLQTLDKWVGRNQTSMAGYKAIVDKTMISASNLAGVLQQQLNAQFQAALLASSGASGAIKTLAADIAQTGQNSSATQGARQQLIKDLENAGFSAQQAKRYVDGLMTSVDGMHGKTIDINMRGNGMYTINGALINSQGQAVPQPGLHPRAATGMYVHTGSGPTADDNLIRVSKGELVVPANLVSAGYTEHLRGMIPGYASGGVVGGSVTGNLTPGFVTNMANDFQQKMTDAMVAAMRASIKAAQVAAAAAAASASSMNAAGVSNSSGYAALKSAAAKRGWGSGAEWAALNNVEMREAGYNIHAQNPHSSAYGMAQFIKGPSEYYQYGGNPNTPAGQAVAMLNYIAQRYGDPIRAWQHELNYGYYDRGGVLPPGWTLAFNGTGKNETISPPDVTPVTGLGGGTGQGTNYIPSQFVGNYTGVVAPVGGGFGLLDVNLGLDPNRGNQSSSGGGAGGGAGGDTGSGGGGSGGGGGGPKQVAETAAHKAAVAVLEHLMSGYIWHNALAKMHQANSLLNFLGVGKYNSQLSEINNLDNLLLNYRKTKNKKAEAATEHLLAAFGVHVFDPETSTKTNTPKSAVIKKLESVLHGDISVNNVSSAGQANSLLTALGVSKFSHDLNEIRNLDNLLAKFKKAKDVGEVKAIETLLRQYGVKKFDLGGEWPNMSLGVNTSGRSEHVVTGAGMDALVERLEQLVKVARAHLEVSRQQPRQMATAVATAVTQAPLHGASLAKRYPNNR